MECKIYDKKQISDKNNEIITYYVVSIKDEFYLICDFDFKGEADLLKAKKSYITVKEPIEQHYLVQKAKTNTGGEFYTLKPKADSFQENKGKRETSEVTTKTITDDEKIKPFTKIAQEDKHKSKSGNQYKNQKNAQVDSNAKISFISEIIKLSNRKHINEKSRAKLFNLAVKEIEKMGNIETDILDRVAKPEKLINNNKTVNSNIKSNPKDVADFMSLFNNRDGLKYLTHDFDEDSGFEIESFLQEAESVFKRKTKELKIPTSLYEIVNQFAFEPAPSWTSYDNSFRPKKINIGWSNEEWINWSKTNQLHPISNQKFENTINDFRKLIRIERPLLKKIVGDLTDKVFGSTIQEYEHKAYDLEKADFYTHVTFLRSALKTIFELIKKYNESKKFKIELKREPEGDYFLRKILITHYNSYPSKELDLLLNEWNSDKGSIGKIRNYLNGYCYWSIETKIENKPIKINILKDEKNPSYQAIADSSIEGFKHILTFYYR